MLSDHGIILKSIPYSDSARIVKCFTANHGLIALFVRSSKKKPSGHLQTGSFIEFKASIKPSSTLHTLGDSQWNPNIPSSPLNPELMMTWLFTLELLEGSLVDDFHIPSLYLRLSRYYAYLERSMVSSHPLIPLILISHTLGLTDLKEVQNCQSTSILEELNKVDVPFSAQGSGNRSLTLKEVFHIELHRFLEHFTISEPASLQLIEI